MDERIKKVTEYYEKEFPKELPVAKSLETKLHDFYNEYGELLKKMSKTLSDLVEECYTTYSRIDNETYSLDTSMSELEFDESISDEDYEIASKSWNNIVGLMNFIDDMKDYCARTSSDLEDIGHWDESFLRVNGYINEND